MSKTYILFFIVVMNCMLVFSKSVKPLHQIKKKDTISSPTEIIETLTDLQQKTYKLNDLELFKKYTDSILTVAKTNNFKEHEIEAVVWQSIYFEKTTPNAFDEKDEYEYFHKALDLIKVLSEDPERKITALIHIANMYYKTTLSSKTGDAFEEAQKLVKKHPEIAGKYKMAVDFGQGLYYSHKAYLAVALSALKSAKERAIITKNSYVLIASLNTMTDSYNKLGQYEEALQHSKEALSRCKTYQNGELWAISIFLNGYTLKNLKKSAAAAKVLELALEIAITNQYSEVENHAHKLLSEIYKELEDFEKSDKHLSKYTPSETRLHFFSYGTGLDTTIQKEIATEKITPKNIEAKYQKVTNKINRKPLFSHDNNTIIFIMIGVFFLLLLAFYFVKKKNANEEIKRLRKAHSDLANDHEDFKTSMYRLAEKIQKEQGNDTSKKQPKYDKSSLDQNDRNQYMSHILDYMEKEKPYLDFDINQSNLANKLNIQSHHFSEVLSFCFKQNFSNFINNYRVNEAKKIMKNPKYDQYKILAIGYEAGFKSKTSFNRVFKTLVGLTPSEYKKKLVV